MFAPVETRLTSFNTLALQYQDDVYTLAYYLAGDEQHAAETAEAAFRQVYKQQRFRNDGFRLEVLRQALHNCRSHKHAQVKTPLPVTALFTGDAIINHLSSLRWEERAAVVLVDVLGLTYDEAGVVLGCSKGQVVKLVAQARIHLTESSVRH